MSDNYPSRLWYHMSKTHNLHLLCSEEADIRNCVFKDSQDQLEKALKERDQWRECAERLASVIRGAGSMRVEAEALDHFERLKEDSK